MSAIGDAMKKKGMSGISDMPAMSDDDSESGPESDYSDVDASPEEVDALKEFNMAKSDEDKASALKTFIKLCTEA